MLYFALAITTTLEIIPIFFEGSFYISDIELAVSKRYVSLFRGIVSPNNLFM